MSRLLPLKVLQWTAGTVSTHPGVRFRFTVDCPTAAERDLALGTTSTVQNCGGADTVWLLATQQSGEVCRKSLSSVRDLETSSN